MKDLNFLKDISPLWCSRDWKQERAKRLRDERLAALREKLNGASLSKVIGFCEGFKLF